MSEKNEQSRLDDEKTWKIAVGLPELQLKAPCLPVSEPSEAKTKPYIQEYFQDGAGI